MIRIDKLEKNYENFSLQVSLEIPAGRITGLIGKNGAGKSTTIKSILGLVKPDGGEVLVMGKKVGELTTTDKQDLGVCLAESGFSQFLCVKDVTAILKKMYKKFDEKLFVKQCKEQGLPMDKEIKDFSTGMKAKLRVLVALSHQAKLLIMDEPTSGLDVQARNDVLDIIRNYVSEDDSRSILISSHIATDLEGLCDDVYLIHDGKVILHEETDILLDGYGVLKMDEDTYTKLDKNYIIKHKKESFGYTCITNEKQFYLENYPGMIVEKCGIDQIILSLTGGLENGWID